MSPRACVECGRPIPEGVATCALCSAPVGPPAPAPDRPRTGPRRAYLTELATKGFDLADTFNLMFEAPFVGWRAELAKPGMSTAGGKQALQHIGLLAQGGGTLVIGSLDPGTNRAELRTFSRVDAMHRERFRSSLPITAAEWEAFLAKVGKFLRSEGFTVEVVGEEGDSGPAPRRSVSLPLGWWIAVAIAIAAVAVTVTVLVLR